MPSAASFPPVFSTDICSVVFGVLHFPPSLSPSPNCDTTPYGLQGRVNCNASSAHPEASARSARQPKLVSVRGEFQDAGRLLAHTKTGAYRVLTTEIALRESTPTAADRTEMILIEARLLLAIRNAEGGQDAADEKGV